MVLRGRVLVALLLALLGAGLSGLLLLEHHGEGEAAVSMVCGEGAESGCATVNRSPWAEVHGVPLAALGLFFSLSLALLLALAALAGGEAAGVAAALGLALLGVALAADVLLLGVQAFAIHAFCRLCLATYAVNAAGLAALFPARRQLLELREGLRRPGASFALAAWALGSVGVAGAVAASDVALTYREAQRNATMLGRSVPSPPPTQAASPAPAATGTPEPQKPVGPKDATRLADELRQAQEQLRRLQDTIDDPNRLQQYLNEKAIREYDQASVQVLDVSGVASKGPSAAPIRVVEFSDFLCPFCRNLAGAFSGYLPQSGNRVAIYFKNYPLDSTCNENLKASVHAGACWLALGGICAQEQGHFWDYHDRVYAATLKDPGKDDAVRLASEAGLNGPALEVCISSQKTKDRLAADIGEAKRLGISATPTVFVNGKRLPRINEFIYAVDKESEKLHLPRLPPPQPSK